MDFNDYGHISGKYWIETENEDSNIPDHLAHNIQEQIIRARTDFVEEKHYWKIKVIAILMIITVIGIKYIAIQQEKMIPVGINSNEVIGKEYTEIEKQLHQNGFTDITLVPLENLEIEDQKKDNIVEQVIIAGEETFFKSSEFPYDKRIVINYNSLKLIPIGFAIKDIKNMNYLTMESQLRNQGFINVKIEIIYDLITGWLVEDVEVIITYHTFKKNENTH